MSLDKVVLTPFTFMFSLKESESCCIAEDANVLTTSLDLDSGGWGSHLSYSLQILVFSLSLFLFFFQARLYWGPSYMHAATSEEEREQTGSLACSLPDGMGGGGELVPYMG